ncbi:MAG TPA: YciI family protein [Bryobacteraceae bacterium]|nr:YciI family protein [Bryobacteraceae bacterium]
MPNPKLFAVIRTHGAAWEPSLPLEGQSGWSAHAAFMDALEAEGFIVLGGPLEGTNDVLLIVRAASPEEILARLEADPWTANHLLRVSQISPWTLRLGAMPERAPKTRTA